MGIRTREKETEMKNAPDNKTPEETMSKKETSERDVLHKAGFDHPCRETCSGWQQGYDRGCDAACAARKAEPVGEIVFDEEYWESAVHLTLFSCPERIAKEDVKYMLLEGIREQFTKDRERLARAEAKSKAWEASIDITKTADIIDAYGKVNRLQEENEKLRRELVEAKYQLTCYSLDGPRATLQDLNDKARDENLRLLNKLAEKDALLAEFMKHTAWAASLPEGWPNLELRKTRAKLSGAGGSGV